MSGRRNRSTRLEQRPAPSWSRRKMLGLLAGAGVTCLLVVAGLVLAVVSAIHPEHHHGVERAIGVSRAPRPAGATAFRPDGAPGSDPRDALAARAMPTVDVEASHPGPVSTTDPGVLLVPAATTTGPAGVPTGYPPTPAGALAQLAAIDQTAIESGSLAGARTVSAAWAQPGGPTGANWSVVRGLGELFDEMGLSGGGSPRLALVLTPLMGLIKGSVGPDFVIPCVDFELDVTLDATARGATADCQRMTWHPDATSGAGGRWVVGPGPEPATPPSVWPDTQAAIAVGYRDLRPGPRS